MSKKKKIRVEFRKNLAKPARDNQWTRGFQEHGFEDKSTPVDERVRAKGDLSRHRTIIEDSSRAEVPEGPESTTQLLHGRITKVMGLWNIVEADDGKEFRCAVRKVLKSLATEERALVTVGDLVWFRRSNQDEGFIERVEPRRGILTRASRRREHVLVANVDQLVIVMSLVQPDLKPHLIDRYLASAQQGGLSPVLCLNKADLVETWRWQSLIGAYARLGIPTIMTSARSGQGIPLLLEHLTGRATVFSGQSGVGKSSLLNAIQPDLALRVRSVSEVNQKGKHTTTTTQLIKLDVGGWVVDTPGIRQLQLWDIIPGEIEGFFCEFGPFVSLCSFPDCSHTHEDRCAVKDAVDSHQISMRRYHSYLGMFQECREARS